jgi:hypothetical protein
MRDVERGASQVPLVICIVLLLVAAFFAYNQYGEREALETRVNKIVESAKDAQDPGMPSDSKVIDLIKFARGPATKYKTRLDEVAMVTGGKEEEDPDLSVSPTKLKATTQKVLDGLDKGEFTVDFPVDRFIASEDVVKVQTAQSKVTINYGGTRDLRGAAPDMTTILDYIVLDGMRRMVRDIKRYRDAYDAALTAKETAEASYRSTLEEKDKEIRSKVEELSALEARKSQDIATLRSQLSDAEAAKTASEEEKNKAVAALTTERNQWRSEAEKASAAVQVLKQRKREVEVDTSPDGTILSVGDKQEFAVIDIGKATNNLMPGTNFEVYAIAKGGQEIPKGVVKVSKVDADSSNCRVLEIHDAFNPIVPGDKIRSITYSPKEVIHVALVGRFTRMGKSDAARRLQALGVVVDEKVTTQTTYLVVGEKESEAQPIEETPEYKSAELYGIPKISERELGKFTSY